MKTIDLSDKTFKKIFENKKFHLPIRWDGDDFWQTLKNLYDDYKTELKKTLKNHYQQNVKMYY